MVIAAFWALKPHDPGFFFSAFLALPVLLITVGWTAAEIMGVRWSTMSIAILVGVGLWYAADWALTRNRPRLARTALNTAIRSVGTHSRAEGIRFEWQGDSTGFGMDFALPYRVTHEDKLFGLWEYRVRFRNGSEYDIYVLEPRWGEWVVKPQATGCRGSSLCKAN